LTASALNLRLRQNYYRILYDDGGVTGESRDTFVTRMLCEEHAPPGLLAGVVLKSVKFAATSTPAQRQALRQAVTDARKPLEGRLERVAARMAAAAARPDVTCRLDARMRLNAGAEVGFGSRRILVGPSLVLLAGSEDALAFVIGHEVAHVVRHHTKLKAAQDLLIRMVTFGYGGGVAGEAIAGILSQGSMPAFNRDKECEADYYALRYMRAVGYRPEAAAEFWKVALALRRTTSPQKVPFVSGYPPEAERVLRLALWAEVDVIRDPPTGPLPDPQPSEGAGPATVQDLSPEDVVKSFGAVLE
jgi:Zn-dependent protease with chaperone function